MPTGGIWSRGKRRIGTDFFLESVHDTPNPPIIELCNVLYDADYKIRIFSGRREKAGTETKDRLGQVWCAVSRPDYASGGQLYPRPEAEAVWLEKILSEDILCVFDDRDKVVEMWGEAGLTCLQVAEGKF
ncbi:MAG: hypothetical protein C4293_10080 [Nitrospiraceae bacterium]